MIISVSRRTDIPAFYGPWFLNRIEEGYFISVNPFNPKQVKRISLSPSEVDLFVFWSKNPEPFLSCLDLLNRKGYQYYFQYTLNDYPYSIEPNLPGVSDRLETFKKLSGRIGTEKVLWRYDPIIISDLTPVSYHIERFDSLAKALSGYTKRVTISFMDMYDKIVKKFDRTVDQDTPLVTDITQPDFKTELYTLLSGFQTSAQTYGMKAVTCCEKIDLQQFGIEHGSCIDPFMIEDVFHIKIPVKKDKNQRQGCLCAPSVDMGMYNCCRHLCRYCYANFSEKTVIRNAKRHNPRSVSLIGEP